MEQHSIQPTTSFQNSNSNIREGNDNATNKAVDIPENMNKILPTESKLQNSPLVATFISRNSSFSRVSTTSSNSSDELNASNKHNDSTSSTNFTGSLTENSNLNSNVENIFNFTEEEDLFLTSDALIRKKTQQNKNSLTSPSSHLHFRRSSASQEEIKETLNASICEDSLTGVRVLNQYKISKILGRGSYGVVHLGEDQEKHIPVAIKEFSKLKLLKTKQQKLQQLNSGFGGKLFARGRGRGGMRGGRPSSSAPASLDQNPIDLVRNEVAIFKKLNHVNVVKLYEVLDSPTDVNGNNNLLTSFSKDSLYMVFECCENGPIMDLSIDNKVKPFSEVQARRAFQQLILGIEYLHENGISHRDIKPDNILLSSDGTLKIVDFGVSEMFVKGTDLSDRSAGSPAFFSPELCVARHGDVSSKAADIWAMGITLYCLIFGKLPFSGASILDIYENIKTQIPVYPVENLNPMLIDLFDKILDKNPCTRITMDSLRNHAWVTDNGNQPIPSKEVNCVGLVTYITEEEYNNAVKKIQGLFTVIKAASKFKHGSKSYSLNSLNNRASLQSLSSLSSTIEEYSNHSIKDLSAVHINDVSCNNENTGTK
ncbi:hypothetical protein HK099_001800 [Clydaea vesicula]|uniref:Protein kinase domain-containing protein n=1 Tax=Clydaea vesicula TaxID=447962 RepID=A0AAD5U367_9FUNG|nr:hypothetical protein HK099_001800 [Clydaea vesicula]